ncbi:uncharacterized protein LOC107786153 [Nicotiana tabacum]|uniref:Uncharacterized protein LOC107786153 n=2 Tax=Nicotiana TaxID=4085 RepID=A0A1S3ZFP0_TOBAC|nr:PREDICTED: uncharacterized protein LOC104223743 [Nicotiana sylvestris]XP_016463092.1 PREDICTED: uncharacterized protein LOC107786153 [Nicotiana tabacum]
MVFIRLHFPLFPSQHLKISALKHLGLNPSRFFVTEAETLEEEISDVFKQWGFTENDISKIFKSLPSSRRMSQTLLQSKLQTVTDLGITSSHLTKIITYRPALLRSRIEGCWQRLQFLTTLFGSNEVFLKAVRRNPSLLTYNLDDKIRPVIRIYENFGLSRSDLVSMLLVRPEMISRNSVGDEKLDLIRRTKVEKGSRMYKYVVSLILVSRVETIREKVANLVQYGLMEDEVFQLFGRSPLVSTLSIDKVKRNMDFVIGTMKLSASVVLHKPSLLFLNLDTVIKPRFLLGETIEDMGLLPQFKVPAVFTALRMTEKRFAEHFINCHPENVRMSCWPSIEMPKALYLKRMQNVLESLQRVLNGNLSLINSLEHE